MKAKLTFCVVGVLGLAASLYGQGTLRFANDDSTLVWKLWPSLQLVPVNGGFVQMMWAPAGSPLTEWGWQSLSRWLPMNPGWQLVESSKTAIGPLPGRFDGGVITLPTSTPGAKIDVVVLGWVGDTPAPSIDEAIARAGADNGDVGISPVFTVDTANPNALPEPEVPASMLGPGGFTGFITHIPEPSSMALCALGAAAVLGFRRSKKARPGKRRDR